MSNTRPTPDVPDPRAHAIGTGDDARFRGWECQSCGHALALVGPWCPKCRGPIVEKAYGPGGVVWSATVFRVPLPGKTPPWNLAWVDVDAGPRVLAHVAGETERLAVGQRVRVIGETESGDVLVAAESGENA